MEDYPNIQRRFRIGAAKKKKKKSQLKDSPGDEFRRFM